MLSCKIDFNVEDSELALEQTLARLTPAYESLQRGEAIRVDLEHCRFLGPAATVLLMGLHESARARGIETEFIPPRGPASLSAYWAFSGLAHRLCGGELPEPNHPDCVTIPVATFSRVNLGLTYPVIDLVCRFLDIDEDSVHALNTCIFETLHNIGDHANSHIGGVISARYHSGTKEVRVAVLDHGDTIPKIVRGAGVGVTDDESALRWASEPGNTTRGGRNLGQGLDTLSLLVAGCHGGLRIFSGHVGLFQNDNRPSRVRPLDAPMPGTLVSFSLRMNPK